MGTLWFVFASETDQMNWDDNTFYSAFELAKNSDFYNMVVYVYFSFTTLSTIGYGDFHPVSKIERFVASFILLIGVALFSFIMGNFIEILLNYKTITADNNESEDLTKWLNVLAKFSKTRKLNKDLIKRLENYFEYYWQRDRNFATKKDEDLRFMSELPKQIRRKIYTEFLFKDFLYNFKAYFRLPKEIGSDEWTPNTDSKWQSFVTAIV